jgi:hypothetical protein
MLEKKNVKQFRIIENKKQEKVIINNPDNKGNTSPLIQFGNHTKKEEKKIIPFWQKVILYLLFEINSAFTQEVSAKVFNARKSLCLTCPGLSKSSDDPIGYCKLCGCGMNPRARLTVKLTVAGATCPKKLWSPVRGKFSVKNFTKSLLGICKTLWYNAKQLCKSKKHN